MVFVSVTRLRIRSILFLPQFVWYAVRSRSQSEGAPGLISGAVMREARNAFWTLTVWESEAAMEAFRVQGAHKTAMPKLLDWCDEAAVAHWTQESRELPSWKEAYERIIKEGRPSKVRHPSKAHVAHDFSPPRPGILINRFVGH
jgi:heme-degrading monooxygenase HmoA